MSIKSEVEAANAAYAADFGDKASLALPLTFPPVSGPLRAGIFRP